MSEKIDRRRYLKYAGVGIVGIAAGVAATAAYMSSLPSPSPSPTPAPTPTPSPKPTPTPLPTPTPRQISFNIPPEAIKDPLIFNVWPFRPDVWAVHTDAFKDQYGEKLDFSEITGDYNAIMTTKLQAGAPLDMFLAQLFHAAKYWKAGWLETIDDLPTLSSYKNDLYPEFADAYVFEGHDLGLLYYSGWRAILTNQKILEQAGMADEYPKNWWEVYEFASDLKKGGYTDTPLGLWWTPEWWIVAEQMEMEVKNDFGVELFDDDLEPVFDTDNMGQVLQRWKNAYNEGLVPKDLPVIGWGGYYSFILSGKAAYFLTESYNIAALNDTARSPFAGYCSVVPNPSNYAFGHQNTCAYVVRKKARDNQQLSRVMRLLSYCGYRDKNGELSVAKRWDKECLLTAPFKEVREDPTVKEAYLKIATTYRGEEDFDRYIKGYAAAKFERWWKAFWAMEFTLKLCEKLPLAITGEVSIPDTISALRNDVAELKKLYG